MACDEKVYVNQALTIRLTDTNGEDMELVTFRVDYWSPLNSTGVPDGTMDLSTWVVSGSLVTLNVPANFMDKPTVMGKYWRFQIIEAVTEVAWTTYEQVVHQLGT